MRQVEGRRDGVRQVEGKEGWSEAGGGGRWDGVR